MGSLSEGQITAAQEFADTTMSVLKTEKGVHVATAIAGVARMAGTFLFRSFGFDQADLPPGQAVFSDRANEDGPRLVEILGGMLQHLGVAVDAKQATDAPAGAARPLLGFLETQGRLEPRFAKTRERLGLSHAQAAESAAVATALLIQRCATALAPSAAFGIALYAIVEGTKTAPGPVTSPQGPGAEPA
jgi:hypothetical protein